MNQFERTGARAANALRAVRLTRHYTAYAEGSVLIECGGTKVLCTASVEEKVPGHKKGQWRRLGHGRIRHAAACHAHARRP